MKRIRTARGRKASSTRWLERQLNDPYVRKAKAENYRSRAAYKLIEIDDKDRLLRSGMVVVDLGAAPGSWSQVVRRRLADRISIPEDAFAQTLITEYRPGTPLGWHRDALNYELVAGISLGGRCRMRFRPYPPRRGRDSRTFALQLEPRSMYVMRDDVRWKWQHSIPATPEHRWSITFRTLRKPTGDS